MVLALFVTACGKDDLKVNKVSEEALHLNRLSKSLKRAFAENGEFPKGKAKTLPDVPTCCGGPNAKCAATTAWAADPIWKALDFSIDEPTLARYSYESVNGKTFTALALADADCDGQFATFTLTGTVDQSGNVTATLVEPPKGQY